MMTLLSIFFLALGLVIGSFLNVVIFRFGTKRGLGGRSVCLSCNKHLSWHELVPVLSYLASLGRCRACKVKLSGVYPAVETATALVFLSLFLKFQDLFFADLAAFILQYAYFAAAFSVLIVIAFYDLRHKIIPDKLSLYLGLLSFAGLFFFGPSGVEVRMPSIWQLLSGPIVALPFALFWLFSKGVFMGLGDAKLALGVGWLIGLSRALSAVVVSFWAGAAVGLMLVVFAKRKFGLKTEIPFAPFLAFGALIAFLFEFHIFPLL